jgi:hypothetical protein
LNETAFGEGLVVRGTHYMSFGSRAQVRLLVQEKILDSWVFLSPTNDLSFDEWSNSFNMEVGYQLFPTIYKLTMNYKIINQVYF